MPELTEEERAHIRLTEQYRHDVRQQLELTGYRFWLEKLLTPAILLFATAFVSGLVIPYILRVDDDQHRAVELKSRLVGDIVTENAAAQMTMTRYNEQLCDYWLSAISIERKKRSAATLAAGAERDGEFEAISAARRREYDLRIDVDRQYADARIRLAVALDRVRSGISLYYGDAKVLTDYVKAVESEAGRAEEQLNVTHQDQLEAIFRAAKQDLKACTTDASCDKIVADATVEVEKVRSDTPQFKQWQTAAHGLSAYIIDHEPVISGSRTALASVLGNTR